MTIAMRKISLRELLIIGITGLLVIAGPFTQRWILPAYDQWMNLRSQVDLQAVDHAKLTANLAIKDSVNQQYQKVAPKTTADVSDQIVLSEYLREIESFARHPSMTLVNMKPMPVKTEANYKIYRVQLAVSGKLQEILQFVSDATHSSSITGLESFVLRGAQGDNMVECSLAFRMIRLTSGTSKPSTKSGAKKITKAGVVYGG
jgi:Tfp pilus assembly protein PilO